MEIIRDYTEGLTLTQRIRYHLTHSVFWLLSLLPLRVLYLLSDLAYALVFHVLRYRRPLVQRHLRLCLPERDEKERKRIERQFYHYLCDIFVETIKMTSISEREMKRRITFEGLELVNEAARAGRSVALLLGHYCNWEWVTGIGLHLPPEALSGQVYHPLENPVADRYFLRIRERMHTRCLSLDEAPNVLLKAYKDGIASVIGYIADQSPGFSSMHYWHDFL
ncbi:MAG: acetyltransferase, partial [Bacteroidaceae bacterium]|nr:acetyltransferase [Bacteroidaceae bacterium]